MIAVGEESCILSLAASTAALHPGFGVVNSCTALGLPVFGYDLRVEPFFTGKNRMGRRGWIILGRDI